MGTNLQIDNIILQQWQNLVNTLVKFLKVDIVLVTYINNDKIDIITINEAQIENLPKYKTIINQYFCHIKDDPQYDKDYIAQDSHDNKDKYILKLKDKVGISSYFALPIIYQDKTKFGSLAILNKENKIYSVDDKNILNQFKNMIESHLLLMDINKKLKSVAYFDYLTGIYNRRYFFETSKHIISSSKRDNQSLSMLMLDIDDFKKINDTYGHAIGDKVLQELSKSIKLIIRESDIFARFGGEEFILLLPNTNTTNAVKLGNKIKDAIYNVVVEDDIKFTVSIGVSTFDFTIDTIDNVIDKADKNLYIAKTSGKNKVIFQ